MALSTEQRGVLLGMLMAVLTTAFALIGFNCSPRQTSVLHRQGHGWECLTSAAAALFLLGRMLFFVRYEGGAASRSFGFAVTFYPTVALTLGSGWFAALHVLTNLHGASA